MCSKRSSVNKYLSWHPCCQSHKLVGLLDALSYVVLSANPCDTIVSCSDLRTSKQNHIVQRTSRHLTLLHAEDFSANVFLWEKAEIGTTGGRRGKYLPSTTLHGVRLKTCFYIQHIMFYLSICAVTILILHHIHRLI